jgi:hypothetical protein
MCAKYFCKGVTGLAAEVGNWGVGGTVFILKAVALLLAAEGDEANPRKYQEHPAIF